MIRFQPRTANQKFLWDILKEERAESKRLTNIVVSKNQQEFLMHQTKLTEAEVSPDFPYKSDEETNYDWEQRLRAQGLAEDEIEIARLG